eukprot:381663-Rhodomonas_salina.1
MIRKCRRERTLSPSCHHTLCQPPNMFNERRPEGGRAVFGRMGAAGMSCDEARNISCTDETRAE